MYCVVVEPLLFGKCLRTNNRCVVELSTSTMNKPPLYVLMIMFVILMAHYFGVSLFFFQSRVKLLSYCLSSLESLTVWFVCMMIRLEASKEVD